MQMRSSSTMNSANNRGFSGHMLAIHQRLHQVLNFGFRYNDKKERIWQCTDVETQRLVIRSIDAFLDHITNETSKHPIVKDSIADMVGAVEGILRLKNESILRMASDVAVKMINTIPGSVFQCHMLCLVSPLSSLLDFPQFQVTVSCAKALILILSNLSLKREREVLEILKETSAVASISHNIQNFRRGSKPNEYFLEMTCLLNKILWRWPQFRFCVWSDANVMDVLLSISLVPDFSIKVAALQLYSTLALCSDGAKSLLGNGETLLQMMVHCMSSQNPLPVRMEAFKLAQCLAISQQGCLTMMKLCCEPIVKAIIAGMSDWRFHSGKLAKDQMCLLTEACRLAMITRWAGEHHNCFWKLGFDRVLVDILLNIFDKNHTFQQDLSMNNQIRIDLASVTSNSLSVAIPFIWDILGWLASHCEENLNSKMHGNEVDINTLITFACLVFVDSVRATRRVCLSDTTNILGGEPACRAVLMMLYSPSKHIASQARYVLSEKLKLNVMDDIIYILSILDNISSGDKFWMPDTLQIIINLMSLACYSALPKCRQHVIKCRGIKTLLAFIRWCLSNHVPLRRTSMAPHLQNIFIERSCCYYSAEEWEGNDMLLLFSLWGLAELIKHFDFVGSRADLFAGQVDYGEDQFVSQLKEICTGTFSPGARWYAAYILSYFGLYGFPTKHGRRMGKLVKEGQFTDMNLILTNQESLGVHRVILMVRCPALLPPRQWNSSSVEKEDTKVMKGMITEVRLSAHIDYLTLSKLLEFVYLGYLQAGAELVTKLKIISRRCNLQLLLQMLCRRSPKWGVAVPRFDLGFALGPAGRHFSDIILESKPSELAHWTCGTCSLSVPHMHVHKVVVSSSCEYLWALFQSGMQESQSDSIKVPVSWEALVKLVNWFYSGEVPKPVFGCVWHNLEEKAKLQEVEVYVELCWLLEFWLLCNVREECLGVVISCLDSEPCLSVKVLQIASNLSQWELAEAAANQVALSYGQLRNSGELDALDQDLVEMARAASVRLSQSRGQ